YSKWFSEYNKLHPDVRINYQSIGSGGGIRQLTAQTVFFGASDGPMTNEQLQGAPGKVYHFPTVLGGVVPIYNLPGVDAELRVAGLVKQTPGAIGYVELIYALQNKIAYGSVKSFDGEFVRASIESVSAAAASATTQMPADFRVSITNAPGKNVYPISSFTWILLYESPKDKHKSRLIVDFMKWALTDGQKFAGDLGYAPLPQAVVGLEEAALKKIKVE